MGMMLIYSGSLARFGSSEVVLRGPIAKQVVFLVIGLVLMVLLARIDYRAWAPLSPALYVVSLVGLAFVLGFGSSEFGSKRWITLAGFQLQPSEPAKLITI